MTTVNNKTALTTRQALGFIGAGIATLVGFVPLAIRATGGAIETLDSKLLDNSLRDDGVIDQLLGQSRVHDQLVHMTKAYAAGMLENTTIKSKADAIINDEEIIVTPRTTVVEAKATEVEVEATVSEQITEQVSETVTETVTEQITEEVKPEATVFEVNTDEVYKELATKLNYNGTQPFEAYLKASVLTEEQVSVLNKYVQMDFPIVDIIAKIELSKEQLELIATQA